VLKKVLGGFFGLGVVGVLGFVGFVQMSYDRTFDGPMPDIKASDDPAVIERGKYMVFAAAHCGTCHGDVDQHEKAIAGEELPLSGGFVIDIPPGKFTAPNITPDEETGIGSFTDGEIARALRYGVGRDGRALFPFMPFQHISDDDLTAIISYLRAQEPVKREHPRREFSFIGKAVAALVLEPEAPSREVHESITPEPTAEYGRHLAYDVANCYGCHTDRDLMSGEFIGEPFGGGLKFPSEADPTVMLVTPNLTKHATGMLSRYDEDGFIARLRAGTTIANGTKNGLPVPGTPMPWGAIGKMTDDDLRAIYLFLESLDPIDKDNGATQQPVE
jgi:mono/diheme cytochrome c family protein